MPKNAERDKSGGKPFRKERNTMDTIFKSLEKTTNRLNSTADGANELIRETNERLGSMGAGVEFISDKVSLRKELFSKYNDEDECEEEAGFDFTVLAYAKIHGTWQLGVQVQHYIRGVNEYGFDDYDLVGSEDEPLLSADRELRIESASRLPVFLQEYTAYLERLANKLNEDD